MTARENNLFVLDTCSFCRLGSYFEDLLEWRIIHSSLVYRTAIHEQVRNEMKSAPNLVSKYNTGIVAKISKSDIAKPSKNEAEFYSNAYNLMDYTTDQLKLKSAPSPVDKMCLALQICSKKNIILVSDDYSIRAISEHFGKQAVTSAGLLIHAIDSKIITRDDIMGLKAQLSQINDWLSSFDKYLWEVGISLI